MCIYIGLLLPTYPFKQPPIYPPTYLSTYLHLPRCVPTDPPS